MDDIVFLSWEQVQDLHRDSLERYGGAEGFIEQGVVESACAQAQQSMFGTYLHTDIAHMAAAYLFHLATTQGYRDGNKRTAVLCAVTFLDVNGFEVDVSELDMYTIAMQVATNQMNKDQLAEWFRQHMVAGAEE